MRAAVKMFDDPEAYGSSLQASELQVLPTARGLFCAKLIQLRLKHVWMSQGEESLPRVVVGAMSADRVVIHFFTGPGQLPTQHGGSEVPPGALILNSSRPIHRKTGAASRWGSISIEMAALTDVSVAVCGRPFLAPSDAQILRPNPLLMARLLDTHQRLITFMTDRVENIALTEVVRATESDLLRLIAHCLAGGSCERRTPTHRRHADIMARFEAFLAENAFQPVYLSEICAATGASERAIRTRCHEHLGMGPVRYLWLRRMHLARGALLSGTRATTTVAQIAMAHGFWELGRFSIQYRALFGEAPSATLLRRPEQPNVIRWDKYAEIA